MLYVLYIHSLKTLTMLRFLVEWHIFLKTSEENLFLFITPYALLIPEKFLFIKCFNLTPPKEKKNTKQNKCFRLRNFLYHFLKCRSAVNKFSYLIFIWNVFILPLFLQYIGIYFRYRIFGWVIFSQPFKMLFHFILTTMVSAAKPVVIWIIVSLYVIYWFSEAAFNNYFWFLDMLLCCA